MVRALDLQLTVMSSNPCHMAIFRFFKMATIAILDFEKKLHFQRPERSIVQNYVIMPNFVEIAGTAAEISQFFRSVKMAVAVILILEIFIFYDRTRQDGPMSTKPLQFVCQQLTVYTPPSAACARRRC